MNRQHIYRLIEAERERQGIEWGGMHEWGQGDCSSPNVPPIVKSAVLSEECGEVARAILDKNDPMAELIQVAAVAVAWLEGME